ncbi:MAG: hypothetical protein LBD64_06925 [Odoribacteraceae bacterium]|jgi:hypothetical protein|nr:hypothetical protein [Odoribacteraceae bacterium]
MGLGSNTPSGKWTDEEFTPRYERYLVTHEAWANERTRSSLVRDAFLETEKALKQVYRTLYTSLVRGNMLATNIDMEQMLFPKRNDKRSRSTPVAEHPPGSVSTGRGFEYSRSGFARHGRRKTRRARVHAGNAGR